MILSNDHSYYYSFKFLLFPTLADIFNSGIKGSHDSLLELEDTLQSHVVPDHRNPNGEIMDCRPHTDENDHGQEFIHTGQLHFAPVGNEAVGFDITESLLDNKQGLS